MKDINSEKTEPSCLQQRDCYHEMTNSWLIADCNWYLRCVNYNGAGIVLNARMLFAVARRITKAPLFLSVSLSLSFSLSLCLILSLSLSLYLSLSLFPSLSLSLSLLSLLLWNLNRIHFCFRSVVLLKRGEWPALPMTKTNSGISFLPRFAFHLFHTCHWSIFL